MKLDVNVLVNKDNPLDLNYIPDNLYIVDDNKDNFHNYKDPNLKLMLRKDIKKYTFFSYAVNEALHLSDQEKEIVMDCLKKISIEL